MRALARKTFDTLGNILLRPPRTTFGQFKHHGPRDSRRIALTFDDGPSAACTPELLDILGASGVKATFFCVGINVQANPELVLRAFREGHAVGSHSMDHRREGALQVSGGQHIDEADRVIAGVIGQRPGLYRPPWGWLTPWEAVRLKSRGYTIVGWDTFTLDWETPPPRGQDIAADVVARVKPGSIVLFHDGRAFQSEWQAPETLTAVRELVPRLRDMGYEFVTAAELLGVPAYQKA